ncbi:hypothetical protein B0H14DRAFT_2625982 [Mycena olivaceomarginata]|nr:hypothetical protein B0H14DRAFT_2625982 [Mycena olivaceomarginata]
MHWDSIKRACKAICRAWALIATQARTSSFARGHGRKPVLQAEKLTLPTKPAPIVKKTATPPPPPPVPESSFMSLLTTFYLIFPAVQLCTRPLRAPETKRNRTSNGGGTGGLERKSMDEDVEAEKICQLETLWAVFFAEFFAT